MSEIIKFPRKTPRRAREPDFLQDACLDGMDRPISNLASIMVVLRAAPQISECFAYDEMERGVILAKMLPGQNDGDLPRPVRDTDVTILQEWLQHGGLRKIGSNVTHQAVDAYARERAFHPVRDYLESLVWDRHGRLGKWLPVYLGAEQTPYTAGIGRMFFVALAVRIFKPGCKADYMLVLEGRQGARKSTACAIIGDRWFSNCLPEVKGSDKDVAQHLRGKWLIEIGEMAAMTGTETGALKNFITRSIEKYLPSFGRKEAVERRQCLFIGTTNKDTYLRDETGARRFWPVKTGTIDTDALSADRDQLFAEAVHLFRGGSRWWPDDKFEREHIKPQQDARYESDVWQEPIAIWLKGREQVYILDIAQGALRFDTRHIGTSEQRRITSILTHLGWRASKKTMKGRPYVKTMEP